MTTVEDRIAADEVQAAPPEGAHDLGYRRFAGPAAIPLVVVIQLAVIWPMAMQRAFDGDEGFYAIAAKLVAQGREPYFDFWFQFTPGLAYIYGTWTRFTGDSFTSLRALSALLTTALGVVLYWHVARRFSRRLGIVAVVLYITTMWVFDWYSTYKSYVSSTLLLFIAYVLVAAVDRRKDCGRARWVGAGIFVGLSVDVRLYFIAVAVVFLYYAIERTGPWSHRLRNAAMFLVGLFVGLLPCIYFFVRDARRFVADSLLSQTSRSDLSFVDSIVQKLRTAGSVLGGAQLLVLVAAACVVVVLAFMARRRVPLAITIAGMLAFASFLPTPALDQYLSTTIPFLVVGVIELWDLARQAVGEAGDQRAVRVLSCAGIVGIVAHVLAGAGAYDAMLNSGDTLGNVNDARVVAQAIDSVTDDGETIIALQPIDAYESHARLLPGLESNFATDVAAKLNLSDARAKSWKMLTIARLEQIVRSRQVRIIALGPYDAILYPRPWRKILSESGYRPVQTVHHITIFERTAASPAS